MERPAESEEPGINLSAVPPLPENDPPTPASGEASGKPRPKPARRGGIAAYSRELGALVLMIAGVALVVLGWWGAAHSELFIDQVPYLISGGILGLGLIITAAIVGASALNERALRELRRDLAVSLRMGGGGSSGAEAGAGPQGVLLVPGGRSYHLAGCPIAEGKQDVEETTLADAAGRGFVACKLCGTD